MATIIEQNHSLIDQAIDLIKRTPEAIYQQGCKEVFAASIGQHMRHCIEHYDELCSACSGNRTVRYHSRPRDLKVETNTAFAIERWTAIREKLEPLGEENRALSVADAGFADPCESSLFRELEFLLSHTVHHFALISIIAALSGIEVCKDFGVASSTLRHRGSV